MRTYEQIVIIIFIIIIFLPGAAPSIFLHREARGKMKENRFGYQ